jgi:hypothetical protein
MRTCLAPLLVATLLAVAHPAAADPLSAGERQRLLAHLEMTEAWLASELAGLSTPQLTFRMTPESWSIADVVEHLAVAEPQYWDQVKASLARPVVEKPSESTDAAILWYGIDRTNRAKTGEARVPTGRFASPAAAHAAFSTLRATMRDYARTTTDDLRGRRLVDGNMDVYQWFLMISTHAQRHVLQVREIKAHPGYPSRPAAAGPARR